MWIDIDIRSAAVLAMRQLDENGTPKTPKKVWTPAMKRALVWTWLGLNIAGQILLLLLLATFLCSRKLKSRRHPVILNFILSWLLSTVPACLLLYSNGHLDRQPSASICLYQAALSAGVPVLVALSFFAVVLQVFIMMRTVAAQKPYVQRTWMTAILIAAPYTAFIGFALVTGIIGFNDPKNVTRDAEIVYCSVRNHSVGMYVWGTTICIVAITLGFGVALVILLWRNWRDVRGNSVVDYHLIFRALCFTVFQLFLIATFMLAIFNNNVVPKFMQAIAPIGVFFIFSTQPDVLRSWFFCRRNDEIKDIIRAVSIAPVVQPSMRNTEVAPVQDYTFRSTSSSVRPPVMRGVPGLHVGTTNLHDRTELPSAYVASPVTGLRTLALAPSANASTRTSFRPSHSPSLSLMSNTVTLRPDGHPRMPNLHHARNGSVSSFATSSYSDLSIKSTSSNAPLMRAVDGMRYPNATESHQRNGASWHSDAGVLVNTPYQHGAARMLSPQNRSSEHI